MFSILFIDEAIYAVIKKTVEHNRRRTLRDSHGIDVTDFAFRTLKKKRCKFGNSVRNYTKWNKISFATIIFRFLMISYFNEHQREREREVQLNK